MFLAILNFFKGRLTKDSIEAARSDTKRMSRQEALQQMRKLAGKQPENGK
ncbi:hypothetical protein GCM10027275_43320 [Rhabdobacter roseus]|uniref:Uncharacterized protein n=1 Tax=Rhabdobacter roseus TaxID=1655419 RepID=A0A840TZ90_9BACT|nr:hypothetical protein [Rhabdobacter roseus]MBB5286613.1 hypothetical protein [Rhabdobacter roseus]